jgi:HEAT repeat protein
LPFVRPGDTGPAADRARAVGAALEPSVIPLARNPDPAIRTKAVVLASHATDDAATEAVVAALSDASEDVQRVALSSLGPRPPGPANDEALAAVGKILATHESWAMRILAAQALGRLGAGGTRLAEAASRDSYALVREAALEALASFDPAAARPLAQRIAGTDPEPRVREAASAIAVGKKL